MDVASAPGRTPDNFWIPPTRSMPQQKQDWRSYQQSLLKSQKKNQRTLSLRKVGVRGIAAAAVATLLITLMVALVPEKGLVPPLRKATQKPGPNQLSRESLRDLLDSRTLARLDRKELLVRQGDRELTVTTTLDLDLQSYLIEEFERNIARKRGTPKYVASVAVDPETGRILSMAGFSDDAGAINPSLEASYPAASIFKIITASAAADTLGITPTTNLSFNGGKYTLYKQQIDDTENQNSTIITFRDSFAQSVNPIFGKLGALKLKKNTLSGYGKRFLFNKEIDFDLPVEPSILSIGDEPYQWAEVACGFNRVTRISPLHGALIGSTALTGGEMPSPFLVESVHTADGKELYAHQPETLGRVFPRPVSDTLTQLMERTIDSGTAHRSFAGYATDPVLKHLTLGGKTGSISNETREVRIDWFVGWAKEEATGRSMVIAVVVGHQEYIGTRASEYARKAITRYFSTSLESPETRIAATKGPDAPGDI